METLDEEYAEAVICQELRFLFTFLNECVSMHMANMASEANID